jgi:ActR/RegA family two-component response regulator
MLIIDDDDAFAMLLARRLQHHGFDTAIASNGDDALALLQSKNFAKAVLDLKLGNDSGLVSLY